MIEIYLLHTPQVFVDGNRITFPYKKAEALFYYLAIEKSISRDAAANLLWESNDELTAKKNLRHALYVIKKCFDVDIVISPQKYQLNLNTEIPMKIDYDNFEINAGSNLDDISLLQGFGVKNAYNYEEWLDFKRNSFNNNYLTHLYDRISAIPLENISEIETLSTAYFNNDALDERIYLFLMKAYYHNKLYYKGIKVYQKLSEITNEELGISPNKDITDFYHLLLNEWSESVSDEPEDFTAASNFAAHKDKLSILNGYYNTFLEGHTTNLVLVGENGIGKSHMLNYFLSSENITNTLILRTSCFQAEKNIPLQPWNNLIIKLDEYIGNNNIDIPSSYIHSVAQFFPTFGSADTELTSVSLDTIYNFNYRACKNSIIKILQKISSTKKLLIAIDDMHAMDDASVDLTSGIMRLNSPNIMFIFTCLDTTDYNTVTFISTMVKESLLHQIPFSKLTLEETSAYIHNCLPEISFHADMIHDIYEKTEGIFFFLNEVINNLRANSSLSSLSLNAQGILNNRLNGISREARNLLDTLSIFHNYATLPSLSFIHNKEPLELLDIIEELKSHALIIENKSTNEIYFSYTHNRMREFVYDKLSPSKCRILHNKAGEALEREYLIHRKGSIQTILTHYTQGENIEKSMYYKILTIEKYFSLNYELYPVIDYSTDDTITPIGKKLNFFAEIEKSLYFYKSTLDSTLYYELEARLYYSKIQYCIISGHYEIGTACIKQCLSSPYTNTHIDFKLKVMREMIYYGIQICDTNLMNTYTKEGLVLSSENDYRIEHAFYHRLRGLYHIMVGEYKLAIASLLRSIDVLEQSNPDKQLYTLSIAAAYNYLGELHRRQDELNDAINYYTRAISLCINNNTPESPTFYTNLGIAYFNAADYKQSRKAFEDAIALYDNSKTLVGKAVARIFLAYFTALDNNLDKATYYITKAEHSASRLQSPAEWGCVRRMECEISKFSPSLLELESDYYRLESENHLTNYIGTYIKISS